MSSTNSSLPSKVPARFDQAFIERRMREHREWQERETVRLCEEVLDEIGVHIPYRRRTTKHLLFSGVAS